MFVYVGTFTSEAGARGIGVFHMDEVSGALTHVQTVPDLISPSFVALHPNRRFLYAVERQWTPERADVGAVSAFAIDAATGHLVPIGKHHSGGVSPCYVSVHPSGRHVFAANYGSGQVSVLPVTADGRLGETSDVMQHVGTGPNPDRQAGPHAHCIVPDPSGRYVLACDLGIDRVLVYRLDEASGRLIPNDPPYAQLSPGSGPRHLAFHPSGRFAYVINELASTLSIFDYDAERGILQLVQTISTLPDTFFGVSHTAQVIVHPSGRFVYGSNRGHDSIAIYGVDPRTGRLTLAGFEPSRGKTPRNFNVDSTGAWLLAGNEGTGTIVTFRIDQETGLLTATGDVVATPSPVCIVFRTSPSPHA